MQAYAAALADRMRQLDAHPTNSYAQGYATEFDALLDEDRRTARESTAFESACLVGNAHRNRYFNVLANEHSRVKLKACLHDGDTDYINANIIPAALPCSPRDPSYYATQAPVPETMAHFWQMVYEARSAVIVMLTSEYEARSDLPKVDRYWPTLVGAREQYGWFLVENLGDNLAQSSPIIERRFRLYGPQKEAPLDVTQLQYVDWPDQDVPENPQAILDLIARADERANAAPPGAPIVVHCSAGVGRTGTFVAIDLILRRLRAAFKDQHACHPDRQGAYCGAVQPSVDDIHEIVRSLKVARSKMVQTAEQYRFIFQAVLAGLHRMAEENGLSLRHGEHNLGEGTNPTEIDHPGGQPALLQQTPSGHYSRGNARHPRSPFESSAMPWRRRS
jgi:protein tyrosine phosphatase